MSASMGQGLVVAICNSCPTLDKRGSDGRKWLSCKRPATYGGKRPCSTVGHLYTPPKSVTVRETDRISLNLALAENSDQHKAIATIFNQVSQEEKELELQLREAEKLAKNSPDLENDISAALRDFDLLVDLATDDTDLGAVGEVFRQLNARLFLQFEQVQPNKRRINKVAGGLVTFGTSPPPVSLYEGPTGRRALQGMVVTPGHRPELAALSSVPCDTDRERQLLGNLNRGERI